MSVAKAVELWPALTNGLDDTYRIGGPAPASDGRAWFDAFMAEAQAKNLRIDFLTMHWYGWNRGSCDNTSQLRAQIEWMERFPGNRPIWITEFGCAHESAPTMDTVNNFHKAALDLFAAHPRIERFAWYPWLPGTKRTTHGRQWADAARQDVRKLLGKPWLNQWRHSRQPSDRQVP